MKKIIYLLLLFPIVAIGQSTNQNYTKVITYKDSTTTPIATPSSSQAAIQVVYYDGLGRPIQQISNKQSASGKNIVTHIEYDNFGRQLKEYLPYKSESTSLDIETDALNSTLNYPDYFSQSPFSEKLIEDSPLNTVIKQSAPGTSWAMGNGHEIKFKYQTNVENEVKLYKASAIWDTSAALYNISLANNSGTVYYEQEELYKTVTYDENNLETSDNFTIEFKDKSGKVILKRVNTTEVVFDTYYVYDQFGNLTYVIPPLTDTSKNITQDVLNGLCYQYKYDKRNRLVEKKLPGKQWEFIVYNNLNLPVATGPAYHPITGESEGWLITKYDVFSRAIRTGWFNGKPATSAGRLLYQNQINSQTSFFEDRISGSFNLDGYNACYTDKIYPSNGTFPYTILTENYYDDYSYVGLPATLPTTIETQPVSTSLKGLATGSWVRVLTPGTTIGEYSYSLYDLKSRVIRSYKTNYLGGFTKVDSKIDFAGKTLYTITEHKRLTADALVRVKDAFTYTLQDRLLTHTHQINDGVIQLLVKNEYDELGQLIVKRVGGTDLTGDLPLQKVDYTYNIRGWLKGINNVNTLTVGTDPIDLFSFKMSYDVVPYGVYDMTPLFNGNIAETYWRTGSDNVLRKYSYQYDDLNRLRNAFYKKPALTSPNTNSYNESLMYDKNGNITHLQRNGEYDDAIYNLTIDNLYYTYDTDNPNQLSSVEDTTNDPNGFKDGTNSGNDYNYDANGNMTEDMNKNIGEIDYNHLNLPIKIKFVSEGDIRYIYNALGQKLYKSVRTETTLNVTDYLDGFQYLNAVLEYFPHAEGYIKSTNVSGVNNFNYVFNYTDHLGNIRLSYGLDAANVLKILEENNYYPFGLSHKNYNMSQKTYEILLGEGVTICSSCPTGYKYKYQGQERQDELGLNWDSFKWRNYDYAIGRFMSIDPLAEDYTYQSSYNFAENKVIDHIELEGLEGIHHTKVDASGNRSHVLEKNIIVLTRKTSSEYSTNKNERIMIANKNRIDIIKSELESSYSDAKNSAGESVDFKFNVIGLEVENTNTVGSLREQRKLAIQYGLVGQPEIEGGLDGIAPAAIITDQITEQSQTNGLEIEIEDISEIGHEVGHTFMTRSQNQEENRPGTGGLMDAPPKRILDFEVDKMINDAIKAK